MVVLACRSFLIVTVVAWAGALVGGTPTPSSAEIRVAARTSPAGTGLTATSPDSATLLRAARRAQTRFEARRVAFLPLTNRTWSGTECDERVGRMCLRFGSGSDWEPPPEREEIQALRGELLETLADIGSKVSGDDWVLGQRVYYLGEAGLWDEAEGLARGCGGATSWWCDALLGYVLHHRERFPEAEGAFQVALEGMPEETAESWRDLERLLDADGARLYRGLRGEERRALEERIWTLANPLLLIPGNDRRTEHFARHVECEIRTDARNPYNLRWSWDLAEITVRYGPEYGWEREWPVWHRMEGPQVVGRFHPRSRGFLPPGEYLEDPSGLPLGRWTVDERRTRARHAPPYAPRVHALDPQVALFRRGDSVQVVASWQLAAVQDYEDGPWHHPPEGEYHSGIFLTPVDPESVLEPPPHLPTQEARTGPRGWLTLTAPQADWVFSLETWHPEAKRAWRARMGIPAQALPEGVVALSELLLTEPLAEDSAQGLSDVVTKALPGLHALRGESVGVVWEVYGLTRRDGELRFRITLDRADRGLVRRAGQWLRLLEPEPPLVITWSEVGADPPGPLFRTVNLDLEALDPGEYELRLELQLRDRTPALARRLIRIGEAGL